MRGAREPTSLSPSPSASSLTSTPVRKSSRSAPLSRAVEPITTIILTTTKQSAPVTAKRKFEVPSLSSAASAPATPNASADSGPATESAKDSSAMFSLFNCLKCAAQLLLRGFDRVGVPGRFVFVALPIALWATWSGGAAGATINHKQHRSAGLYAWNNFTDIPESVAEKGSIAGFDSESSVVLPGSKTGSGCPATTSSHCLRCNADGCIKCPLYLVTDTRQCVDQCPSGYVDQWSAHTEFMGRVCVPTGYSGPMMAAFAGLIGGFLVCLSLLAVAVMLVKRKRRRKTIKQKLINEHSMDRADFLRQLNEMRPNAEYFLAMLNDTRRQIRKLYLSGEVAAANSYRPLVRDLAKILILLNRPIELIPAAPHDWGRLHAWSEQALDRYKPQVGQLIDFFQTSGHEDGDAHFDGQFAKRGPAAGRTNHEVSIFKPSAGTGSVHSTTDLSSIGGQTTAAQKMHLFGSLISLHEFEEPRPSDPFGSSFNTLKGNLISDLNASSLWLEDEFYKLGFRPQDVITTEL